jgi:hypothetical protein
MSLDYPSMEALHWNVAACSIIPFGVCEKERANCPSTASRRARQFLIQDSPSIAPSGQKFRNAWTHIPGYGCRAYVEIQVTEMKRILVNCNEKRGPRKADCPPAPTPASLGISQPWRHPREASGKHQPEDPLRTRIQSE